LFYTCLQANTFNKKNCCFVPLLKHADVEGKKLTWNLQVIASAVTVKLIWIKAAKPIATIGKVDSQAPKKRHMYPKGILTSSPGV
jgi:hypothetical protein